MQAVDHIDTVKDFLDSADREFAAGEVVKGWGELWDAVAHSVSAVASQRGWPCESHKSQKKAVRRLADETGDIRLMKGFSAAELHYHRHRTNSEFFFSRTTTTKATSKR